LNGVFQEPVWPETCGTRELLEAIGTRVAEV